MRVGTTRVKYCWECGEDTVQTLVSEEHDFEGCGLFRGFMAITTFGLSEADPKRHWQCNKCGKLNEK